MEVRAGCLEVGLEFSVGTGGGQRPLGKVWLGVAARRCSLHTPSILATCLGSAHQQEWEP